jgi:MscS family membrane protein
MGGKKTMINRRTAFKYCAFILFCLILAHFSGAESGMAQAATPKMGQNASDQEKSAKKAEPEKEAPSGPMDEYNRGNPRSSVAGYFIAARNGDFEKAARYLDSDYLPSWIEFPEETELAHQLKIALDRSNTWIDLDSVSEDPKGDQEDGLPADRDIIGQIKMPAKTVDILLQRVAREDGVKIWKFSNRTVAEIPQLYQHFGYKRFEEKLSRIFPDFIFLGWQSWQWVELLVYTGLAYLIASLVTWLLSLPLRRQKTDRGRQSVRFVKGPIHIILWLLILHIGIQVIGPSATMHTVFMAGTLWIIALSWAAIRFIHLVFEWWADRLHKIEQSEIATLVRPLRTIAKIIVALTAALMWLSNIGFNISTLLTGLGVGGIAVALAAQDTLKNFIGSIMILLDKPYRIGQRIVVKGHDGVVEEIGLRSTRMRLLTGPQTTIPNDQMAMSDVENIGQRPHIRRLTNIAIAHNTPRVKVEKALDIIQKILDNHEGMDPKLPPRIYFNEFNPDSLNILVLYWYHPADYWAYLELCQRVNLQILLEFEKEGIQFALQANRTYLTQDIEKPLQVGIVGNSNAA